MALQADFKNRGGLQSLFNPKAGNKVFALDSVLPDANRTRPQKPATGKLALPAVPGSRNVGGEDPLKAGSPVLSVSPELEPVRESDGFSPALQDAVQTMMQSLQEVKEPQGTAKVTNEPEMTAVASEEPAPDLTSTSEAPKPAEPQTSESRMRRAIARTRWPAKPPERIEEIKNIEVFAERLVDAYGSLTKAFEAFDSHDRSEVTRSQFDAALDAMHLDVEELCGIPASKLFSMVSRASKKPIGALTEQAWNSFFKKYLGQTSSAHLLEADYSIQAALSHLAELHQLQPSSMPRERKQWTEEGSDSDAPPRRWCVVAAVLDDAAMSKLANLEDTGSTDRKKNMQEEAGGGRRRGAVGSQEDAEGSSASGDSDDDATTRRRLAQDQAGDGSRDGRGQLHGSSGGSGVKEGTSGEDEDAKLLANGAQSGEASYSSDPSGGNDTRGQTQEQRDQRERLGAIGEDDSTLSPGAEVSNSAASDEDGLQTSASARRAPGGESGKQGPSGPGPDHGSGSGSGSGFSNCGSGVGAPSGASGTDGDGHRSASKDGQAEERDGRRLHPGTGSADNSSASGRGPENSSKDAFGSTPADPLSGIFSGSTRDLDGRTDNMGGRLVAGGAGAGGAAGSSVGGSDGSRDAGADAKDGRTGRAGISSSFSAQGLDGAPAGSKSFSGHAEVNRRKYQSEPIDLLARAAAESQSHSAVGAEGGSDEAGDATSGLKVAYTHGKAEESSDSEVDDEISSIGIEEDKTAGDIQSLVKRVFRLYATGYSKGQYVFIRNPDLSHFMDDAKEALPAHRKKFRRFKRIFESIFDDTIQLQCDMPGQGLRITAGLTLDWFQVFVQKAVRRVGTEVMGFFMALLEAQGC